MSVEGSMPSAAAEPATFELERFAWGAPDRLELVGRFLGLPDEPGEPPVLAVRGADGVRVLHADPGSVSGGAAEGERWQAEFAWDEAPSAFDDAELRLGDLVVGLPDPRARRPLFGRQILEVRRAGAEPANDGPVADVAAPTERVRLQADLLVAHEEAMELRTQLEHALQELAGARAELEAERERHAEAVARFRRDVEAVSASAEQAVAADREEVRMLRARVAELERELADAREREREQEDVRTALDEARSALEGLLARLPGTGGRAPGAG